MMSLLFRINYIFSFIITAIWFYLVPIRKSFALEQIKKRVHHHLSPEKILFRSMLSFVSIIGEHCIFSLFPKELERRIINYKELKHLNLPAIFFVLHIGAFDLLVKFVSHSGVKGAYVARPLKNTFVNTIHRFFRKTEGLEPIDIGQSLFKGLKYLKNGGVLAFMGDQHDPSKNAVYKEFLGENASFSEIPLKIATRRNIPVYSLNLLRVDNFKYRLDYEQIYPKPECLESEIEIDLSVERNAEIFSRLVKKHPDQWFWLHRRWKKPKN